jgi:hypothetical protein
MALVNVEGFERIQTISTATAVQGIDDHNTNALVGEAGDGTAAPYLVSVGGLCQCSRGDFC